MEDVEFKKNSLRVNPLLTKKLVKIVLYSFSTTVSYFASAHRNKKNRDSLTFMNNFD